MLWILWVSLFSLVSAKKFDYYYYLCAGAVYENTAFLNECPQTDFAAQDACLCASQNYWRTMLTCVDRFATLADNKRAFKDSAPEILTTCTEAKIDPPFTIDDIMQSLKTNPVNQSYEDAMTSGTGAFLLEDDFYNQTSIDAGLDYHFQHWVATTFGEARLGYVFGIVTLQIFANFIGWVLPSLNRMLSNNALGRLYRQHFALPATFSKNRAEPVNFTRLLPVTIPPRMHSFLIAGYFVMTIVFLSYRYPLILSSLNPSKPEYVGANLGYRSGIMCMYNMPIVFLFAGRNNFLIWLTGWHYEVFQHWHRWIARVFTIEVIIHAGAWTVYDKLAGRFAADWSLGWWNWGVAATVFMCFMCFLALKSFRAMAYDLFVIIHILLAIGMAMGTWYHIRIMGETQQLFYASAAVWGFDRVFRVVRILASNPFKSNALVVAHEDDIMELTVSYSGLWKPRAGNYVFIHFLDPLRFWQSHPFTIMRASKEDENGKIKLYAKARNGLTRHIYNKASQNQGSLNYRVWVDGPYGVEFNIKPFKETVLVAGGIGITAVYSHLIGMADEVQDHTFFVHWVIKDQYPLIWFKHEIEIMRSMANVDLTIYIAHESSSTSSANDITTKGSGISSSTPSLTKEVADTEVASPAVKHVWIRPNFVEVCQSHIVNSQGPVCVFVCGPASMSDDVRYGVSKSINLTKNFVQFYEESFTM